MRRIRWLLAMAADIAHRPPARQPSFTSKEHPGQHQPARPVCEQTLNTIRNKIALQRISNNSKFILLYI
jgi:hypothetical protein